MYTKALVGNRRYRRWFVADTASEIAVGINSLVFPLIAAQLSGSTAVAGALVALSSAGSVMGLLPGGVIADHLDRRGTVSASSAVAIGCHAVILLCFWCHWWPLWLLGVLFLVIGFCTALLTPVFTASLKQLVPAEQFPGAVGANEARSAVASMTVPLLAGALLSISGALPLLVSVVCLVTSWASFPRVVRARDGIFAVKPAELFSGFAIVWRLKTLRVLLVVGMLLNVAVSTVLLIMIFNLEKAGVDAGRIGRMQMMISLGGLVGALCSGPLLSRARGGVLMIGGMVWLVSWLAVLPWIHHVMLLALLVALSVVPGPVLNATLMGYTLVVVPARLQGRVDAAMSLLSSSAAPLAPLIAGLGTSWLPGFRAIWVCALISLVAAVLCVSSAGVRSMPTGARMGELVDGPASRITA